MFRLFFSHDTVIDKDIGSQLFNNRSEYLLHNLQRSDRSHTMAHRNVNYAAHYNITIFYYTRRVPTGFYIFVFVPCSRLNIKI